METLIYIARCVVMLLVAWAGIRIIGKKSIAQMTGYELAGMMLLTTTAAEPLVFKITSKAAVGAITLAVCTAIIGTISLHKKFYHIDSSPSIVIANGKIDHEELRRNKMNLPFLLSQLRILGYAKVADVEYAIIEPDGQLSVIPKSQARPVKTRDLGLRTNYEGLALPLVIDGEIQYNNLKYAKLTVAWLQEEIKKKGAVCVEQLFLAELDSEGTLYVDFYDDALNKPPTF